MSRPRRSPVPLFSALAVALATAVSGVVASPAAALPGPVALTGSYAGAITPTSTCASAPAWNTTHREDSEWALATDNTPITAEVSPTPGAPSQAEPAGARTDYCISYTLTEHRGTTSTPQSIPGTGDDQRSLTVNSAPGFLASPSGIPTCSNAQFGLDASGVQPAWTTQSAATPGNSCPAGSQVGTVAATVDLDGGIAASATGGIFLLASGPNEVARLGIEITAPQLHTLPIRMGASVTLVDGHLRTSANEFPRSVVFDSDPTSSNAIYLSSVGIKLWGKKADHPTMAADFVELPGQCGVPLTTTFSFSTYGNGTYGPTVGTGSTSEKVVGCDALPFVPTVDIQGTDRRPGVATALTAHVAVPAGGSPQSALIRNVDITMPAGLEVGAQVASGDGGLPLCTAEQFAASTGGPATCPAGSKVGTVSIVSPLIANPLVGDVFLGPQSAIGELPALYIQAALDPGVDHPGGLGPDAPRVKLVGKTSVGDNGQVRVQITDAPQLRFSSFDLNLAGGEHALFSTPRTCGTTSGSASITPWSGTAAVALTPTITVDQDCTTPALAPALSMTPADSTVGSTAPTTVALSRPDRSPWFKDMKVALPSGFLANLNLVSECGEADLNANACPAASRMGTVVATSGSGDKPYSFTGAMYYSARPDGAVAGASIVVHAKIGEIDLGTLVVPTRLDLRPTDAGINLVASVPLRFHGLALNLRTITVNLDREGFPLSPTACGPLTAGLDVIGDGGETGSTTTQVAYTGCAARGLQPSLAASLTGDTAPLGHPQVNVTITPRAGDTNLKSAVVTLPAGVATDLKNLQSACAPEAFNAGACPAANRVGSVSANVSITSDVISGDVFLVKVPGEILPGLGLNFTGRYTQRVLGTVKVVNNRVITRFDAIPDLPITKLSLVVDGGAKSPIQLPKTDCVDTAWEATFGGQGGQAATAKVPVTCAAKPAPKPALTWSKKSGFTFTVYGTDARTIRSAKLTLPKGFKLRGGKATKKALKITVTNLVKAGASSKAKASKTSISVSTKGKGATKIVIKLKASGYTAPKSFKKGKTVKPKLRVGYVDGKAVSSTLSVKAKP